MTCCRRHQQCGLTRKCRRTFSLALSVTWTSVLLQGLWWERRAGCLMSHRRASLSPGPHKGRAPVEQRPVSSMSKTMFGVSAEISFLPFEGVFNFGLRSISTLRTRSVKLGRTPPGDYTHSSIILQSFLSWQRAALPRQFHPGKCKTISRSYPAG